MSIFEAIMLLCFGASWPMSIVKTVKTKNPAGKSLLFLYLVLIGYICGCLHKYFYSWNPIFWMYALNGMMVATDIILTHYYLRRLRRIAPESVV